MVFFLDLWIMIYLYLTWIENDLMVFYLNSLGFNGMLLGFTGI